MALYDLLEAVKKAYSSEPLGAVSAHEAKQNAHPISGVNGLQAALDAKPSRNILINGEVTRINQRGFDGNWGSLAVGAYGYDRWKKQSTTDMSQVIEAGNFIPGEKYRLSGVGVTAATLTAPASGNWAITVPQSARKIQLELGEVATPFEVRNIQQELAMCQRYYQLHRQLRGISNPTGDYAGGSWLLPVMMRATPTVTNQTGTVVTGSTTAAIRLGSFGANANALWIDAFLDKPVANWFMLERISLDAEL